MQVRVEMANWLQHELPSLVSIIGTADDCECRVVYRMREVNSDVSCDDLLWGQAFSKKAFFGRRDKQWCHRQLIVFARLEYIPETNSPTLQDVAQRLEPQTLQAFALVPETVYTMLVEAIDEILVAAVFEVSIDGALALCIRDSVVSG